jgi:hypothetical protein
MLCSVTGSQITEWQRMVSGLLGDVNEICALLGFYAAPNDSFVPTIRYETTIRGCVKFEKSADLRQRQLSESQYSSHV